MRQKLPLFLIFMLVIPMGLFAQDTIRSLVITEWRGDWAHNSYLELTNMGETDLDLSEFTLGLFVGGSAYADQPAERIKRLEGTLPAGETYLVSAIAEGSEDWIDPPQYPKIHPRIQDQADLLVYIKEDANRMEAAGLTLADDSISPGFYELMNVNRGERAHFLFHHTTADDSAVVDGVGLVFDPSSGDLIMDQYKDVAGIGNATETHILVRKYNVTEGNPNWKDTRGATPAESDWMAIPFETGWYNRWSGDYTTAGNHGVYTIDDNSVKAASGVAIDIDFNNKVITVPWGVYRDTLKLTPWRMLDLGDGLAWQYALNGVREDSIHTVAQSGDIMTLMAVGNELQRVDFTIDVAPPTNDMNLVFPVHTMNNEGEYTDFEYYEVTQGDPVIDSITSVPFATRVDTLMVRLEKAPDASWTIDWVDGNERPDLKYGDKLVVTAASGAVKEYFIAVEEYEPNHNAFLDAITWPEIPEYLRGNNGWQGDTIPNFLNAGLVYEITVPYGVEKIPALVPHTQNTNARVETDRATTLRGSLDDRTTVFTVYAEDDTTYKEYKVLFKKEILQEWIQPFTPDPFFSQVSRHLHFKNFWTEIFNPGNQDLDLSGYMLTFGRNGSTPTEAIEYEPPFEDRYYKYIPGYKYADDETVYASDQMLKEDLAVNPVVKPGETWLFGQFAEKDGRRHPELEAITDFHLSPTVPNVWGITYAGEAQVSSHTYRKWPLYLFKIKNEAVLNGEKLPNDPADFELIDVFGRFPNSEKVQYDPAGINGSDWSQGFLATRKDTVWKGNPTDGGAFGTNAEDSEYTDIRWKGIWDSDATNLGKWEWCAEGLGIHNVQPITVYKSTISSLTYLVSEGYEGEQSIDGIPTGATVDQMYGNLIKADENQYLKVISIDDGSEKNGTDALALNDTLLVTSADSANVTKYVLDVGDPLDDNAVLTSEVYEIAIDGTSGTISGVEYGMTVSGVLDNVTAPTTATLNIINSKGDIVPTLRLNSDTVYVETHVQEDIFFEVVAQNGTDKILYQLQPAAEDYDAFVISDLYEVNQDLFFINYINNNTAVSTFMNNVIPVEGATVRVLDKAGYERTMGQMAYDDVLEVTSKDGNVTNVYYLGFKAELEELNTDAYVVSDVYTVDQTDLVISGVPADVQVPDFKDNLTPALGATMIVTDDGGLEQTSGAVMNGYYVEVTSEDGNNMVSYLVDVETSVDQSTHRKLSVYPNPTRNVVYVDGLERGDVIRVINVLGVTLQEMAFETFDGAISLENEQPGLYLIQVATESRVSIFKVYKE